MPRFEKSTFFLCSLPLSLEPFRNKTWIIPGRRSSFGLLSVSCFLRILSLLLVQTSLEAREMDLVIPAFRFVASNWEFWNWPRTDHSSFFNGPEHPLVAVSAPPAAPDPSPALSLPWTCSSPSRSFVRGCSELRKREEQFSISSVRVELWKTQLSFAFNKISRNCFILGNEAPCRKGVNELEQIHQASQKKILGII